MGYSSSIIQNFEVITIEEHFISPFTSLFSSIIQYHYLASSLTLSLIPHIIFPLDTQWVSFSFTTGCRHFQGEFPLGLSALYLHPHKGTTRTALPPQETTKWKAEDQQTPCFPETNTLKGDRFMKQRTDMCPHFGHCSAPLCPCQSFTGIWYPGEEICCSRTHATHPVIVAQKKIGKVARRYDQYYSAEMLSSGCIIGKAIEGLNPNKPEDKQLFTWKKKHPSLSKERRRSAIVNLRGKRGLEDAA